MDRIMLEYYALTRKPTEVSQDKNLPIFKIYVFV